MEVGLLSFCTHGKEHSKFACMSAQLDSALTRFLRTLCCCCCLCPTNPPPPSPSPPGSGPGAVAGSQAPASGSSSGPQQQPPSDGQGGPSNDSPNHVASVASDTPDPSDDQGGPINDVPNHVAAVPSTTPELSNYRAISAWIAVPESAVHGQSEMLPGPYVLCSTAMPGSMDTNEVAPETNNRHDIVDKSFEAASKLSSTAGMGREAATTS
jgi:hypothetical protein